MTNFKELNGTWANGDNMLVIFTNASGEGDWRMLAQKLPAGAVVTEIRVVEVPLDEHVDATQTVLDSIQIEPGDQIVGSLPDGELFPLTARAGCGLWGSDPHAGRHRRLRCPQSIGAVRSGLV